MFSGTTPIMGYLMKNKLIGIGVILMILIVTLVIMSFATSPPTKNTTPNQSVTRDELLPTQIPQSGSQEAITHPGIVYKQQSFSEKQLEGINFTKTQQADGTTRYTFPSIDTARPNELITDENGIVSQRVVVSDRNKYIYHYTNSLGAPDYTFMGTRYYGQTTMTYVFLDEGLAFVAKSDDTQVLEQINFRPTDLDDFKQKYGTDVADFTVIPTLADEESIAPEDTDN